MGERPTCEMPVKVCYAATKKTVSSRMELERALASGGELHITLKKDITVDRLLRIKGKKTIYGGKYQIRRKAASGNSYKGTLLYMQGETLQLSSVTLEGSGKSQRMSGDINGKLIEVASGTLILDSGAKLSGNYNFSSYTDGGGGITVHNGGTVIMNAGSVISDHLSMTGGSGVRIEWGGTFIMEGGTIRDNVVVGQRDDSGFDGRGGAIHNRGTVWIKDGVICGNFARGYAKNGQACGGYGGAIYNQGTLRITGGMIRENQASFGGGAIYTNERGKVVIEGGEISYNGSEGQRGGGIYLSAASEIVMSGGCIRNNSAKHGTQIFIGSMASGTLSINGGSIQGEADAVYANGGHVIVSGGEIKGKDCALRSRGVCEIRNGTLEGSQYGICYDAGRMMLSGSPSVSRIYLGEGMVLTTDKKISLNTTCQLCPADYNEGRRLVKITSGESAEVVKQSFSLRKKKRFTLEAGKEELYIGRERYEIEFMSNGGLGSMKSQTVYVDEKQALTKCSFWREDYGFVGWSKREVSEVEKKDICYGDEAVIQNLGAHGERIRLYALWVKKPVLKSSYGMFVFYEGENVTKDILLFGMSAEDEHDGDLTGEIQIQKILLPDGTECELSDGLPTKPANIGKGKIIYQVINSFGISGNLAHDYEIIPNQKPELIVYPRYFFVSDHEEAGEHVKADILQSVSAKDDTESEEQLKKEMDISWGNLDPGEEGCYKINISVCDQYGNRFYMSPGEEKRYGSGKEAEAEFTVTVVQPENKEDSGQKNGYVRFVSRDFMETLEPCSLWRTKEFQNKLEASFQKKPEQYEEIWEITGEDKKRIKVFAHDQEDPFSKETNNLFLKKFGYLKKRG